jgi:threonine/homoserine/homoserine lactone efflux protein
LSDQIPFIVGVLALLATPGPTNTLMAAAGAQRGVARSLPLLASEVLGYFIAITAWTELVGAASASQPWVPVGAKLLASAFLIWSAWKLWQNAGHADFRQSGITPGRVLGTTLVNPKALIFAFAIFPPVGFVTRLPYLGLFTGLVIVTAVGWMTLGMLAARRSAGLLTSSRVERITAVALAAFAMLLMVQTIESML